MRKVSSAVASNDFLWFLGDMSTTVVGELQRWDWTIPVPPQTSIFPTLSAVVSPIVINEEGHIYVIIDDNGLVLRRYNSDGTNLLAAALSAFVDDPVGSPVIGQPVDGEEAEMYVVTQTGIVYAFNLEDLTLLWQLDTGIGISSAAQPLLVGNTLWIVGTQGQVRAVRVNSQGLNQRALWPKHLKDNCNTGNAASSAAELPGCFN
jgi:outer membrane protein assembly factor BamB